MSPLDTPALSVIIAANNEEGYIQPCLEALLAQNVQARLQVIVAANACTDRTIDRVAEFSYRFAKVGHALTCMTIAQPGKTNALNQGDAAARAAIRIYLDADVICDPALLGQVLQALSVDHPLYATGTLAVMPAKTWITRAYARIWTQTPFVKSGAVGAGFFAVNGPGRARWQAFPDIISDDTFVRLHFAPPERVEVPARYHWPMVEGLARLIRVRRRQNAGVDQIAETWPDLLANEGKDRWRRADLIRTALRDPVGMAVYLWVHVAVRLRGPDGGWTRGR